MSHRFMLSYLRIFCKITLDFATQQQQQNTCYQLLIYSKFHHIVLLIIEVLAYPWREISNFQFGALVFLETCSKLENTQVINLILG